MGIAKPIIEKIADNTDALNELDNQLHQRGRKNSILSSFPVVYIHNWKKTNEYEIYIGETNNIIQRTRNHYMTGKKDQESWQSQLNDYDSYLYVIGHEHFNKSMTLDVENRLMQYMISVPNVRKVHNLRGNPQINYYPENELDEIFGKIWKELRKDNKELFPDENSIRDSAIFKASPLHKLTEEQINAREFIIDRILNALDNDQRGQLIFIEGEAGTGKTVLNSSTFYELYCREEERGNDNLRCKLIVNHDEQIIVYEQIAEKLGLIGKYGQIVCKPTHFINSCRIDDPIDVAFIDEAHLLLTQGKQSYQGNNQLEDIIKRSRVIVVMFDENQILTTEQYWEAKLLDQYKAAAKESNNYIVLKNQMRMNAGPEILNWIDAFTKGRKVLPIPKGSTDYKIRIFDSPEKMDKEICRKAEAADTALSRLIATYDWEYSQNHKPEDRLYKYWEVIIGSWHKPWNRELEQELSKNDKKTNKKLAWAEQYQTIGEIGSTFTIQGFDLNYAGVILGPSVKYRNEEIIFDPESSYNQKAIQNRTLSDGTKKKFGESLIQHEVRVLMTRGVNGLYIYACDDELRKALIEAEK